jgi:acetyltransferase-like isoleucine patch superfamily enzyme
MQINGITVTGEGEVIASDTPRSVLIEFKGAGHRVVLDNDFIHGKITISGRNNTFTSHGFPATSAPVHLKVNIQGRGNQVVIGRGTTSNGLNIVVQGTDKYVLIGQDCMFSHGIWLRNSDMHAIIDVATKAVTNEPGNILLEDHVWVGQETMILKNTTAGKGSIIAARALVSGDVPAQSLCGGMPAKVLRGGVTWSRHMEPTTEQIDAVLGLAG